MGHVSCHAVHVKVMEGAVFCPSQKLVYIEALRMLGSDCQLAPTDMAAVALVRAMSRVHRERPHADVRGYALVVHSAMPELDELSVPLSRTDENMQPRR